jgi:hypothetical protein
MQPRKLSFYNPSRLNYLLMSCLNNSLQSINRDVAYDNVLNRLYTAIIEETRTTKKISLLTLNLLRYYEWLFGNLLWSGILP